MTEVISIRIHYDERSRKTSVTYKYDAIYQYHFLTQEDSLQAEAKQKSFTKKTVVQMKLVGTKLTWFT